MSDGVGGSRFVYAYARRAEWWEGLPSRCRGNPPPPAASTRPVLQIICVRNDAAGRLARFEGNR